MPNGVERHAAEKQRETQAHPRRKDHGQLPRFGQEVISLRQPAVGADLVLGLDQVLHHRVGQQQSELVRLEGEQLPLEGEGVGLAVTEAGGHYLEVDGSIPRRFSRFVASGIPQHAEGERRVVREAGEHLDPLVQPFRHRWLTGWTAAEPGAESEEVGWHAVNQRASQMPERDQRPEECRGEEQDGQRDQPGDPIPMAGRGHRVLNAEDPAGDHGNDRDCGHTRDQPDGVDPGSAFPERSM